MNTPETREGRDKGNERKEMGRKLYGGGMKGGKRKRIKEGGKGKGTVKRNGGRRERGRR